MSALSKKRMFHDSLLRKCSKNIALAKGNTEQLKHKNQEHNSLKGQVP
jgi:hypothetical protein